MTEDAGQGAVYYPYRVRADGSIYVAARTELAAEHLVAALRTALRTVDPEVPLSDISTMDARIAASLRVRRSPAILAGLFAALAILLTVVGIYGVVSYAVAQRRREIGVRMALGARPAQIRSYFLSVGFRLFLMGMAAGVPTAWLAGRSMQSRHLRRHLPALLHPRAGRTSHRARPTAGVAAFPANPVERVPENSAIGVHRLKVRGATRR